MKRVRDEGFKIDRVKVYRLTEEEAEDLYKEHSGQPWFSKLVKFMNRTDSVFFILSRQDAIEGLKALAGDKDPEVAKEKQPGRCVEFAFISSHLISSDVDGTALW